MDMTIITQRRQLYRIDDFRHYNDFALLRLLEIGVRGRHPKTMAVAFRPRRFTGDFADIGIGDRINISLQHDFKKSCDAHITIPAHGSYFLLDGFQYCKPNTIFMQGWQKIKNGQSTRLRNPTLIR